MRVAHGEKIPKLTTKQESSMTTKRRTAKLPSRLRGISKDIRIAGVVNMVDMRKETPHVPITQRDILLKRSGQINGGRKTKLVQISESFHLYGKMGIW